MLDLLQQGFGAVFSLNILLLMLGGVAVGIVFGAVPGLSATMAVALCLPLTFTMGPQAGLSLLVALFIGATIAMIPAMESNQKGKQAPRRRFHCRTRGPVCAPRFTSRG